MFKSEKINGEKEELQKQFNKMQSRETQFIHELRKKELIFANTQEQLKKLQKDKNILYVNSFASSQNLNLTNSMKVFFFINDN